MDFGCGVRIEADLLQRLLHVRVDVGHWLRQPLAPCAGLVRLLRPLTVARAVLEQQLLRPQG
ncbi:MAG TPA: hypothetical protein VF575_03940 [Candidatus Saccharimonadales bacterium]